MGDLLCINNLSCGYNGKFILNNVTFSLESHEILAIIGQNGCGKSTLLKTITGIIKNSTGSVILANKNLKQKSTWEMKNMGLSWFLQGGMVFPTMKVSDHFTLVLKDKNKIDAVKIKEECLHYFPALVKCMNDRGGNLSGGQKQMLSFAMLLAQQTSCWLLDEPTAGLAPEAIREVVAFLKTMKQEKKITMVIVEHNYPVVFNLADNIAIIKDGKLSEKFSKKEFQKENFLNSHLYN